MNLARNGGRKLTRTRTRGIGTQTAVVSGTFTNPIGTTDANGILYVANAITPANASINSNPVYTIGQAYEFFRVRSVEVEFVPTGGTAYNGQLLWGFVDNPELMATIATGNTQSISNILQNTGNASTVSLSYGSKKRFAGTQRVVSRRWYSMNYLSAGSTADFDRTVPTMFVMRAETGIAAKAVSGLIVYRITYEFNSLGNSGAYTFASVGDRHATQDDPLPEDPPLVVANFGGATTWPPLVNVKAGALGIRTYSVAGT